jgi:hypothetical protein
MVTPMRAMASHRIDLFGPACHGAEQLAKVTDQFTP